MSVSVQVVQFLRELAQGLLHTDPSGCWELFLDFGLAKVCALLRKEGGGAMRSLLLSIVYSFCADTIAAHITAIKALQVICNCCSSDCLSVSVFISQSVSMQVFLLLFLSVRTIYTVWASFTLYYLLLLQPLHAAAHTHTG